MVPRDYLLRRRRAAFPRRRRGPRVLGRPSWSRRGANWRSEASACCSHAGLLGQGCVPRAPAPHAGSLATNLAPQPHDLLYEGLRHLRGPARDPRERYRVAPAQWRSWYPTDPTSSSRPQEPPPSARCCPASRAPESKLTVFSFSFSFFLFQMIF